MSTHLDDVQAVIDAEEDAERLAYGEGDGHVAYDDCDFCEESYPTTARVYATQQRPSDPSELVAVMWGCGKCRWSEDLPTADKVWDDFEAGKLDPRIIFVSI